MNWKSQQFTLDPYKQLQITYEGYFKNDKM
jgi:hypothetical protein